jgi:hypothetical protein
MKSSQRQAILDHLRSGQGITAWTALERYGCLRLAARIAELRESGYPIISEQLRLGQGKRVAMYRLDDARRVGA